MNKTQQTLIALVIVLVVIAIVLTIKSPLPNLNGIWIAPQDFCEKSGVGGIIVYFGTWCDKICPCYIIIYGDNDTVLENLNTDIKVDNVSYAEKDAHMCTHIDVSFADEPQSILPQNVTLVINMDSMVCVITANDTVYALLYKNNELSAQSIDVSGVCAIEPEASTETKTSDIA